MSSFKVGDRVYAKHHWSKHYPIIGIIHEQFDNGTWSVKADGAHFDRPPGTIYSRFEDKHLTPEVIYNTPLYQAMSEDGLSQESENE